MNKHAQSLGKSSWESRIRGKSKKEISEMMSKLKKGKTLTKTILTGEVQNELV